MIRRQTKQPTNQPILSNTIFDIIFSVFSFVAAV